ncbi:MAG: hypothetical protein HZA11_09235 [Nitrospirae bacterium]|nr:hypothetical protein [Nitrospirota bacterium]
MKRIIILLALNFIIFLGIAFAETSQIIGDLEKLIKEGDWRGAYVVINNLPSKTEEQSEDKKELSESSQNIINFLEEWYRCRPYDNGQGRKEALRCYISMGDSTKKALPQKFFSPDFIKELNKKTEYVMLRIEEIPKELQKEKEERNAKLAEKQKKKEAEEQEKQRQKDRPIKEEIAQKIFSNVQEKAFESIEYKTAEITCNICSCMTGIKQAEYKITEEKIYAKKYGTINLSKIDGYKQGIIHCNGIIKDNKVEYKEITKKNFNTSDCKKIQYPCEDSVEELRFKLMKELVEIETNDDTVKALLKTKYFQSGGKHIGE